MAVECTCGNKYPLVYDTLKMHTYIHTYIDTYIHTYPLLVLFRENELLCRQAGGVEGIVNGMDTTDWSPNVDKFLDVKYDADTVDEGKALAKETLQAELGLPVSCSACIGLC